MLTTELIPAAEKRSRHVMVVLHGLGDSMEGYRWLPDLMGLPWLNYLLVNAPDSYYAGYSWYDFAGDPAPGVCRSREMIFALLKEQQRRGFRSEETFIFGFSQGCLMTIDVGLRYPARFAGLIGISGYIFEPEALVRELSPFATQQRILLTHGTQDGLIPLMPVKTQVALLRSAGIQIEWHEFAKGHTIAGEEELAVIREFIQRCSASARETG